MGYREDHADRGSEAQAAAPIRQPATAGGALFPKLRPGPGQSTDHVIANQRARLCGATVQLVAERGYSGITVREISRLAGVSTKTFYECFTNIEDCFVATYSRMLNDAVNAAPVACARSEDRLRRRLRAFFGALAEDPKGARLVLVEALAAGPALRARTYGGDRALERFLAGELAAAASTASIHPAIVDGAAAAAFYLARSRLLSPHAVPSTTIADEFADWILSIGEGAAVRISATRLKASVGHRGAGPSADIADDYRFLLAAVTRLSMRDGYAKLTIPAIRREAGVSRRSFDKHFDGVADCFLGAVETRIAEAFGRAEAEAIRAGNWETGIVRAVRVLCAELSRDHALARLAFVDILAPGAPGLELRERLLRDWADRLRRAAPRSVRPGRLAAEASVAAAMTIAGADVSHPTRTVPRVAFVLLAPAIGPAAAERAIAAELRSQTMGTGVRKHLPQFS